MQGKKGIKFQNFKDNNSVIPGHAVAVRSFSEGGIGNLENMPNESAQPFDQTKRSPDDATLVGQVSGSQAEADMRELLGQTEPQGSEQAVLEAELGLSNTEVVSVTEEEKNIEQKRFEEYVIWAKKIGWDKDLVENNFTFNPDGTVVANCDLDLTHSKHKYSVKSLPPGLIEVKGYLNLAEKGYHSLEEIGLPDRVGDTLRLSHNPIESLEGLPRYIGGDLYLGDTKAKSIPNGLEIVGNIILWKQQDDLIIDCEAKGYSIDIL